MLRKELTQLYQESKKTLVLIFLGTLSWSLTMVKSGLCWNKDCAFGIGFWGPNGHDGIWHIALAQGLAKGSWGMPVFAGETIKNYHLGFDLILAGLHKITFIPITVLYFQIIPPVLAFLTGVFVFRFVYEWKKSKLQAFWATFFVYFGGSFGWIITLIREGKLEGESLFWSQESISTLVNPPFALSLLIIFLGLNFLIRGLRVESKKLLTVASFLFGILIQVKAYAGFLVLAALFVAAFWRMIKRKGVALMKVTGGALVISILFFSPLTSGISSTLIFAPFWFLEAMMATPDRVDWPRFAQALANYKLAGNWIKEAIALLIAFLIFWFGNLGTRVIKEPLFFLHLKNFKKLHVLDIFIYTIIGIGVLIPIFFIQSGTPWNTIQFFYYSLIFSGVFAGIALGELVEKSKLNSLAVCIIEVVVVLLTIPTTVGTLWFHYLPARPPAKISNAELKALNFLSRQPDGIVLTFPFDKEAAQLAISSPPRPLYLYESTAYVSAFGEKTVFLEDEVNLEITGYDWSARRRKIVRFWEMKDGKEAKEFLTENNIAYVYLTKPLLKGGINEQMLGKKIFENEEVSIFRVI